MRRIIILLVAILGIVATPLYRAVADDRVLPALTQYDIPSFAPTFLNLVPCPLVDLYAPVINPTPCHKQIDFGAGFRIDFQRPFSLTADSSWPYDSPALPFGVSSRTGADALHTAPTEANDVSLAPFDLTLTSLFIGTDEFSLGGRLAYWLRDDTTLLTEQSDTETLAIDLNAAYQFANGPLTFTPGGRLMYSLADDPALATASDSLSLDSNALSALTLSLGGHVSYELNQDWGLLLPFAGFQWTHAFESSDSLSGYRLIPDITGQPLRLQSTPSLLDAQDEDYFNLGVGFSAQFNNGAAAFLNYQKLLGHDELDNYRFKAGLRFDF